MDEVEPDFVAGTCIACFDDDPATGLFCSGRHLLCGECISGLVRSQIGTGELRRRAGGLACVAVDGSHADCLQARETAFERAAVQPLLQSDVLAQYVDFLAPCVPEAADDSDHNLTHWVAELLNVTCPSCDEFLDPRPDGCIAMRCSHCSTAFCWMCFAVCGRDAHQHALQVHGDYFPPPKVVESWHTRWRWRRIVRLASADTLPSKLPKAADATTDSTAREITLTADQTARLASTSHLLRACGL